MSENIYPGCDLKPLEISQDSDVMEGLRKQWCCVLEEILECPICLDVPESNIFQCTKGHNICETCRMTVGICPICQAPFNGTRNWCSEEIVNKLTDMKSILLDPTSNIDKCYRVQKISQGTQTEKDSSPVKKNCVKTILNEEFIKKETKRISRRKTQ